MLEKVPRKTKKVTLIEHHSPITDLGTSLTNFALDNNAALTTWPQRAK